MIEISNRHYALLIDKLPRVLDMARKQHLSLRQQEDIRQIQLMHNQLSRKYNPNKKQK